MKIRILVKISSLLLLLFLSFGAIYGGLYLVIDPSGISLGLPISLIDNTPFTDYLIPGMILFVMIGLLPLSIAALTVFGVRNYGWFIVFQGCVLAGWLTVEVIMGIFDPFVHTGYYGVAALLIIIGIAAIITENRK
jgi:hypothetical protein